MKNRIYIFIAIVTALVSCKQNGFEEYSGDEMIYLGPEPGRLYYTNQFIDTLQTFSFYYAEDNLMEQDVLFHLYTTGRTKDYDRTFTLRQLSVEAEGFVNAEAGVHYKAFDSDEMQKVYTIKAGEAYLELPIKILRPKDNNRYILKFELVENENFRIDTTMILTSSVQFSAIIEKPASWNSTVETYYFGEYSTAKHQWMEKVTGMKWDDETLSTIMSDYAEITFWKAKFGALLEAEPVPILDENNNPISFPK